MPLAAPSDKTAGRLIDIGDTSLFVEERLPSVTQPVLVIAGRHDRTCSLEGARSVVARVPDAELVVLEESAHMTFVEEDEQFISAVRGFLGRRLPSA